MGKQKQKEEDFPRITPKSPLPSPRSRWPHAALYHTRKALQGEGWLGEIAAANQNSIKDVRALLPGRLRDHIPLARGGEVGALTDAHNRGLQGGREAGSEQPQAGCVGRCGGAF